MTTENILFLIARVVMVLLCGGVAVLAVWRMQTTARAQGKPNSLLGVIAIVLGVGVALALHDSWDNVLADPRGPITFGSWLWLLFDLAVPLLALRVMWVMAERDRALAELAALSVTDPLTGLANRRGFDARCGALIAAARRQRSPCALLAFDIDHFKQINDGWGHPAGDAVLRETARALAEGIRPTDALGRLGGEEFGALLAGVDPRQAAVMAERLRQAVRDTARHPGGGERVVTLSVGVAAIPPAGDPAAALRQAVAAADAALYAAKRNGRDRVEMAGA